MGDFYNSQLLLLLCVYEILLGWSSSCFAIEAHKHTRTHGMYNRDNISYVHLPAYCRQMSIVAYDSSQLHFARTRNHLIPFSIHYCFGFGFCCYDALGCRCFWFHFCHSTHCKEGTHAQKSKSINISVRPCAHSSNFSFGYCMLIVNGTFNHAQFRQRMRTDVRSMATCICV